jgi:ABC-2 type transport system permease protein
MAAVGDQVDVGRRAWKVVAERELRDLWLAGRGLPLLLAYSVLLSVTSYLVDANQALNFLEQRQAVSLTLQVAVAVGALLVLLGAADSVSGERERGTLESLLLSPAPRRALIIGKGVAALSLWVAAWIVSLPYVWYLGRGVDVVGVAVASGLVVGSLLALYAPTQMPTAVQSSGISELLLRVDPFTAGLRYLGNLIISGHSPSQDAGWLIGPVVAAVVAVTVALTVADRLTLTGGDQA